MGLFHGTQNVEFQIVTAVCINDNDFIISSLFKNLSGTNNEQNRETILEGNICAVRAVKEFSVDDYDELMVISECVGHAVIVNKVLKLTRVRIRRELIHSAEYTRVISRNSFTVAYRNGDDEVL